MPLASLALMMRSRDPRSMWATDNSLRFSDRPSNTNLDSSSE